MTELYRAVREAEARSIEAHGLFINPAGVEAKYFALSLSGVRKYASNADRRFGDGPYRIVRTTIRSDRIEAEMMVTVDSGIETVVLPTWLLPDLTAPEMVE
jgi:hypothetical protein